MSREAAFIDRLRGFATDAAARGLRDDAAVLPRPGGDIVLTHDMLVEGVHYLPDDPAEDVAWKLVAVNLSDLAAKGARPTGLLLGYAMTVDAAWDARFADGLAAVAAAFDVPLLGGDTVRLPDGAPRMLGLTAIGAALPKGAPSRAGAKPGDRVCVTGTIGDAAQGLASLSGRGSGNAALVSRYRRPIPRLAEGQAIAPFVNAMADVSDGLLIDARRMAEASGCAIDVELDMIPLSQDFRDHRGSDLGDLLFAATGGDDYELLFTVAETSAIPDDATIIGVVSEGWGIKATFSGKECPLPDVLGYEH